MALMDNIKSLFGKKKIKVGYNVKNASVYLEWNSKAELFKIYQKIKNNWYEFCITYDLSLIHI